VSAREKSVIQQRRTDEWCFVRPSRGQGDVARPGLGGDARGKAEAKKAEAGGKKMIEEATE
jgi:hypothetical protein